MRKVGSFKNAKLQGEQFDVLTAMVKELKDFTKSKIFLRVLLTKSERAIISQRLDILRMILKGFKYRDIEEKLKVNPNTINHAVKQLEQNEDDQKEFSLMMSGFRFNPDKYKEKIKVSYPNRGNIRRTSTGVRQLIRDNKH